MIDSHAHLTDKKFTDDLDSVVSQSATLGITQILTVATNTKDSMQVLEISNHYPHIDAAVGVHPHDARSWDDSESPESLEAILPKAVALGEIGLDYYYNFSEPHLQRSVFTKQINLAIKCNKPVIIHCRDAFPDLMELLKPCKNSLTGGVVHCFTGSITDARQCLDLGYYLGFGGMLTFPKLTLIRDVAQFCPVDRMLLETDCPYLSPVPLRGKRNHPGNVRFVYDYMADLKGMDPTLFNSVIAENYNCCFKQ